MFYAQLPHNSPNLSSTTLWFPHHITGWVFTLGRLHSFRWSFRNPDSSHAILCPFFYTSSPSASISRRKQEYGEMHMEVYDETALGGYRPVSLLLFWTQFISVATKATGKSCKCSPQEG